MDKITFADVMMMYNKIIQAELKQKPFITLKGKASIHKICQN